MAKGALSFLDQMQGTIKQMKTGISLETHLRNTNSHIVNSLNYVAVTPDIEAAAQALYGAAHNYCTRHSVTGGNNERNLQDLTAKYHSLRALIVDAKPSQTATALGLD